MQTNAKTLEIQLTDEVIGKFTVSRYGQAPASVGDHIQVLCRVLLPAPDERLHAALSFGSRLRFCDLPLTDNWGHEWSMNIAYYDRIFTAPTWALGFKEAEDWAIAEFEALLQALATRQQALKAAEDPPPAPEED